MSWKRPGANDAPLRTVLNRPRAVFDCVVFLQAAISSRGPAASALAAVEEHRVELFVANIVLLEIEDVLNRPNVQSRFPQLTAKRIAGFLRAISDLATWVDEVPSTIQYIRDPDDEAYLNLAIVSAADFLVTRDRDPLDLEHAQNLDGQRLKAQAANLRILDPVAFLKAITVETPA
jgi:putative PIN family toxin of toxin-antitoxin system